MSQHEIVRNYGWTKAEERDHNQSGNRVPRYSCACGMPLAMTKRRAVGVHRAHLMCQEGFR